MEKKNAGIFKKIGSMFLIGAMIGTTIYSTTAYAENFATVENILEVDPVYVGDSITIEEEPVVEFEGTVSENNSTCEFTYTAPRNGRYYFDVTDLKQNCSVRFDVFDSLGNNIGSYAGKMIELEESEIYTIRVRQNKGNTSFTVQVHQQKPSTDITDITEIKDQITFPDQKNVYFYTAPYNGTYYFSLSNTTANVDFSLMAWDQYDSNIINTTLGYSKVDFEAGETYQIQVRPNYEDKLGKYTLNVQAQKPSMDISGYTDIKDSLEFFWQRNDYYLTAPVSGEYEIEFTGARAALEYKWAMFSDNGEVFNTYGTRTGDENETVTLDEGQTYEISLIQIDGSSDYTLKIEYPSSAQQYLKDFSNDIIEETEDNELNEEKDEEVSEFDDNDISSEDLILQQLEELQSEMNELKDENEMLKNALEENEIEFD